MEQKFLTPEFREEAASRKKESIKRTERVRELFGEFNVPFDDGFTLILQPRVFGHLEITYIYTNGEVKYGGDNFGELEKEYPQRIRELKNDAKSLAKILLSGDGAKRKRVQAIVTNELRKHQASLKKFD